jgi:hypothetical protein
MLHLAPTLLDQIELGVKFWQQEETMSTQCDQVLKNGCGIRKIGLIEWNATQTAVFVLALTLGAALS